jgi:hypothetical protein
MRRAARVDSNQAAITNGLRLIGATVQPLHTVGKGCPDLLVGFRGVNWCLEVKDGDKPPSGRKLTPDEQTWHDGWQGVVHVVESVDDVLRLFQRSLLGD